MQATVHRFDPVTSAGAVVTDDGRVLPFTAEVFAGSRLRLVRVGQRLTVTVQPSPGSPGSPGGPGVEVVTGLRLGTVGAAPGPVSRP